MTRWKRELEEWADREGLEVRYIPKEISHESWAASKVMAALANEIVNAPGFEERINRAVTNMLIMGQ